MTRDPRTARRLGLGFAGLVAATTGLIVLGALVRAHGAGLACPDWPLCFGEVVPAFDVKVAFEWGHRATAGAIGLAFVALSGLTLAQPGLRRALWGWIALAAGLLALQILLGALTVWELLASWSVTSHLLTGNAFNASLLVIALRLRDLARPPTLATASPPRRGTGVRALATLGGVLLAVQMLLGGLVASTYSGLVCPEWPACVDGVWFPHFRGALGMHLLHRLNGYAVVAALAATAIACRGERRLGPATVAAGALAIAQVGVGVLNVLLRLPVEVTALHSGLAAGLVLTQTAVVREAWASRAPGAA